MWTVVRTHEPPLARPAEFFGSVWCDLRRSRPLATEIAKREIRSQYRRSLLGPLGALVFPLALTALALGFNRSGILKVDSAAIPYALYVLVGVVLWTTFIEVLNISLYGLPSELRLLARTTAPPEAIILGKLGPVFANLLLKLALLDRAGADPADLLRRQRAVLEPIAQAIEAGPSPGGGFDATLLAWRRSTAAAALEFLDTIVQHEPQPGQRHG